jgi:hypothetical protein
VRLPGGSFSSYYIIVCMYVAFCRVYPTILYRGFIKLLCRSAELVCACSWGYRLKNPYLCIKSMNPLVMLGRVPHAVKNWRLLHVELKKLRSFFRLYYDLVLVLIVVRSQPLQAVHIYNSPFAYWEVVLTRKTLSKICGRTFIPVVNILMILVP